VQKEPLCRCLEGFYINFRLHYIKYLLEVAVPFMPCGNVGYNMGMLTRCK